MKETLQLKVSDLVAPYLDPNGCIAPGTYHPTISGIHSDVVTDAIGKLVPNRVLIGDLRKSTREKLISRKRQERP